MIKVKTNRQFEREVKQGRKKFRVRKIEQKESSLEIMYYKLKENKSRD